MKNQFKKSLSLVMAVLMILSCWVWVAPEKASAAATPYYIKFVSNVTDSGDESGARVLVTYKDNNGQGTQTTDKVVKNAALGAGETNDFVIYEGMIDGWPSQIKLELTLGTGRTERHESFRLYIGSSADNCNTQIISTDSFTFKGGTNTCTLKVNGTAPYFNEITNMSATDATITKLPSGVSVNSTVKVTGGKDQYGVDWKASIPTSGFSYSLKKDESTALASTYGTISGSSNSATATLYDDVQKLFPNAANGKVYAYATYNSKSKSVPISLTFPTYDITFDANGGKIGSTDTDARDQIVTSGIKYGGVIGKSPANRTKNGFTFMGFYSVQNADATGLTPSFSGTLYKDSETTVDAVGDSTWYAAWQAEPITATFMTADNQLIGTVEGRYNNYYTATNMYNGLAGLNAKVKEAYSGTKIQFDSSNAPIYKDGDTTYTFAGWKIIEAYDDSVLDGTEATVLKGDVTFQAVYTKADAKKYTVSFEDGAGNVVASNNTYNYRDAVTGIPSSASKTADDKYTYEFIGWAKKLANVNYFAVDANDCDEDGIKLSYTSSNAAEFIVKGDDTYVPVFRMTPKTYNVSFTYYLDGKVSDSVTVPGYKWDDSITVPESIKDNYTENGNRHFLTGWKLAGTDDSTAKDISEYKVNGDVNLVAVYGITETAKFEVVFYDKDQTTVIEKFENIENGGEVTVPAGLAADDTGASLYTFKEWNTKADGSGITVLPGVKVTVTADATYYAVYNKQDYAKVNYIVEGDVTVFESTEDAKLFVGDKVPYFGEDPVKAEDKTGTYRFIGWNTAADGSGETVVPGTSVITEAVTTLYAQFETTYNNYTVKFLNEDGTVVSEKTYHYATEIEIPANPTKESDVEFVYDFKAWTPDVSEVCYGDATYTATYRRTHQYYKVTWLKDDKSILSESNYRYNQTIQQAVFNDPVNPGSLEQGKTWSLAYWVKCDAAGNPVDADGNVIADPTVDNIIKFKRGDKMLGENLYFYPVFEQVDKVITVTFNKIKGQDADGNDILEAIGTEKIAYGKDIAEYGEAYFDIVKKQNNENYHYTVKWVDAVSGADVTNVTSDVSVKPAYTEEAHDLQDYEITKEPTCTETGLANIHCTAEGCDYAENDVELEVIADNGAPTGQIYVGTNKWTLKNYTDGIDYSDVKYVGPRTDVIVNAEDIGTRSKQNPFGELSRGVDKIDYYVSEVQIDDLTGLSEEDWTNVYTYAAVTEEILEDVLKSKGIKREEYDKYADSEATYAKKAAIDAEVAAIQAGYKANATGILSNLELEDGKTYILYIRVSDRDPDGKARKYSSNVAYFSSGTIYYGTKAPVITATGDGNGTKFCSEATIRIEDDTDGIQSVTLDGAEVETYTNPGTTAANGKFVASFKTTEAGAHEVIVVDKNGNKKTFTFEIKGLHSYKNYTMLATCESAGLSYDICSLCGDRVDGDETPALGHLYGPRYSEKQPTCVEDGYRTYVCYNNCGSTKTLYPTSTDFTGAYKFNEETQEYDIPLTAEDLKYLKATGEHTYAKALDEDGKETADYAWVIDKEATCAEAGSKHRDCIKCGDIINARVVEEIPIDKVNGHKYYREKITTEPTCTTPGQKTKTCRYCADVVVTEVIEALGHSTEDANYRTILEPTCTTAGSKILTCDVCGADVGEAIEIPALGHKMIIDGDVYSEEVTDEETGETVTVWYQNYKCSKCGAIEKKKLDDYQPPVAATVTFKNGEAVVATFDKVVGESIIATDVATPEKAADATYKYTFSHWEDAAGNEVKFPIDVTADATYSAVYAEKYVNYTITYYKEDGATQYKKTGYLHNGETVALAEGPAKAANWEYTYTFAGWKVEGGDTVYTDEVTIDGANITLVATYDAVKRSYGVTLAYSNSQIISTFAVAAGANATENDQYKLVNNYLVNEYLVGNYNSKSHYEFNGWNRANQLTNVQSNIYATPDIKAIDHSYSDENQVKKSDATCTEGMVVIKTCECGYSIEEVVTDPLGHKWKYETVNGVVTKTCERCHESEESTESYTVKFYANADDAKAIKTMNYLKWGTAIDITTVPAPTKASDDTYDYTFAGWFVKGDATETLVDFATYTVTTDAAFVASYTKELRSYTVTFMYDSSNIIEVHRDIKAGDSVTFGGSEPVKKNNDTYHYSFSNWNGYEPGAENAYTITITNIKSDLKITAKFKAEKHTYDDGVLVDEPSCTQAPGYKYTCTADNCNHSYTKETGKPLDHQFVEIERKEATALSDGYVKSKCETCGEEKTETIKFVDDSVSVKVTVLHNGAPKSGIQVELQSKGNGTSVYATTNANGVATFAGEKNAAYTCWVVIDGAKYEVALENAGKGNLEGTYSYTDQANCTCACHRDNVWGAIFRFFHKIIKLFTGEFKCCGNPDPMYG